MGSCISNEKCPMCGTDKIVIVTTREAHAETEHRNKTVQWVLEHSTPERRLELEQIRKQFMVEYFADANKTVSLNNERIRKISEFHEIFEKEARLLSIDQL